MRILRICHAGRDPGHRERERALVRAGAEVMLVVPSQWPGGDDIRETGFEIVQAPLRRPGDVNRHRFVDPFFVEKLCLTYRPDVVDLHEEPFSAVVHQVLRHLPNDQVVTAYTAQNIDKRFPPPFAQWERRALGRLNGVYPCSAQAASVVVGKGFCGPVEVLPLAPPPGLAPGDQYAPGNAVAMLLVGRLVPEKGLMDAVSVLAAVRRRGEATLDIVGEGPEAESAVALARQLGVQDALRIHPWVEPDGLATYYRNAQVVLVPSKSTRTWVEQFGRIVVEAHAAGAVVVAYASGSLPEVVGEAGILVQEGDVIALADAVVGLVGQPERWFTLREAGFAAVANRTWHEVASRQLNLYAAACDGVPSGRSVPQRTLARNRYGAPASVDGGGRPFALPLLRNGTIGARMLARALDATALHRERGA